MCGIAGYFTFSRRFYGADTIQRMSAEIAHRGPDDEGYVLIDTQAHHKGKTLEQPGNSAYEGVHDLALGHRRFSIIDLSSGGHQPMWNRDGSLCIVFNGEIFNYIEVREELKRQGVVFSTQSDTEVILAAYEVWGSGAFSHLAGFWAIALYDSVKNRIILSRDRIGKKPLYIYRDREFIAWASEIKSLLQIVPGEVGRINESSVWNYLYYGKRDVGHRTFWENIVMLDKASVAVISPGEMFHSQPYWEIPGRRWEEKEISFRVAAEGLLERLTLSLKERLRADVPLAFELSGGMDSSTMVALRAQVEKSEFSVFTVKYADKKVDEYGFAREVTRLYPFIRHHIIDFREVNLWEYMPAFIYLQEEPFHNPNLLVSQLLRRQMREYGYKAIVTGAGGDEVLAGYTEYAVPIMKHLLKNGQRLRFFKNLLLYKERYPLRFKPLAHIVLNRLFKRAPQTMAFDGYISVKNEARSKVIFPKEINELLLSNMKDLKMHYWMSSGEKAAMGIPLETRSPFLDHRVVEFLFQVPVSYLMNNGWLKWLLRKSVQRVLPKEVLWRKTKQGYPFPLERWLMENHGVLSGILKEFTNPWVDNKGLLQDYEVLAELHAPFLWRAVNLQMWYTRMVEKTCAIEHIKKRQGGGSTR